jgi:hypothetical protein
LKNPCLKRKSTEGFTSVVAGFDNPKMGLFGASLGCWIFFLLLKNPFTEGSELATPYLAHIPFGLAITDGFS